MLFGTDIQPEELAIFVFEGQVEATVGTGFMWFMSVFPGRYWNSILTKATAVSKIPFRFTIFAGIPISFDTLIHLSQPLHNTGIQN